MIKLVSLLLLMSSVSSKSSTDLLSLALAALEHRLCRQVGGINVNVVVANCGSAAPWFKMQQWLRLKTSLVQLISLRILASQASAPSIGAAAYIFGPAEILGPTCWVTCPEPNGGDQGLGEALAAEISLAEVD